MGSQQDISLDQLRNMLRGNEMRRHSPSKAAQLYSPKSEVERYDSLGPEHYDQNAVRPSQIHIPSKDPRVSKHEVRNRVASRVVFHPTNNINAQC